MGRIARTATSILLLLGLLPGSAFAQSAASVFHDLAVSVFPSRNQISVTDTITVRPGEKDSSISLPLAATARILSVERDGKRVPFTFAQGFLRVTDDGMGAFASYAVKYEATFKDPVPVEPVNTEDPSFGVVAHVSERGTFLSSSSRWYPDIPGSSPSVLIRVTTPAGFEAITDGERLSRTQGPETTSVQWRIEKASEGITLAVGKFVVRADTSGGIPIYTYLSAENDNLATVYLNAVDRYLGMYRDLFGPYPFPKFAVVENFFPSGFGFPSWTLLGSNVLRLPFIPDTSLPHEIAHSWWGNGVIPDGATGNWSEGLTTYSADYLVKERENIFEAIDYRRKLLRDFAALVPPEKDFPLSRFAYRTDPATRAIGYGKSAMVFHMLRRKAGDVAFFGALRDIAATKTGSTASWEDFALAMQARGMKEAVPFLDPWVTQKGAPLLSLADVKVAGSGNKWRVTGTITSSKPSAGLMVPLRLQTKGEPVDAWFSAEKAENQFTISATDQPERLLLDPDADLFRKLHPAETPATVNHVVGSNALSVVAAASVAPETVEAAKILLSAMGREGVAIESEADLAPSALVDRDVLYIGLPKGTVLPKWPDGFSVAPDRFTAMGTSCASPQDALFAVFPKPSDPGRSVAVFLPLSPKGAVEAGRKITHYGKYSWATFSAGKNCGRGTWDSADSPASIALSVAKP